MSSSPQLKLDLKSLYDLTGRVAVVTGGGSGMWVLLGHFEPRCCLTDASFIMSLLML